MHTLAGFKALVEENVKHSVMRLRDHGILSKVVPILTVLSGSLLTQHLFCLQAYSKSRSNNNHQNIAVFVHGLVFDETSGNVYNLGVSFGPPGEAVPAVPFKALAAAKNFHRDSDRPGIHRGKTWDFSAHSH
jgi:carbonic anhydrase